MVYLRLFDMRSTAKFLSVGRRGSEISARTAVDMRTSVQQFTVQLRNGNTGLFHPWSFFGSAENILAKGSKDGPYRRIRRYYPKRSCISPRISRLELVSRAKASYRVKWTIQSLLSSSSSVYPTARESRPPEDVADLPLANVALRVGAAAGFVRRRVIFADADEAALRARVAGLLHLKAASVAGDADEDLLRRRPSFGDHRECVLRLGEVDVRPEAVPEVLLLVRAARTGPAAL
jgi:hypothetical protein